MDEPKRSKNHIAFINNREYFLDEQGNLYKAPADNPLDIQGYRQGARFEAPPHLVDAFVSYAFATLDKETN
jgi:hypothetical protein